MTSEPYVRAAVLAQLEWEANKGEGRQLTKAEAGAVVAKANSLIGELKSSVLRDVLEDLDDAGLNSYAANEFGTWLSARADRIEEEVIDQSVLSAGCLSLRHSLSDRASFPDRL